MLLPMLDPEQVLAAALEFQAAELRGELASRLDVHVWRVNLGADQTAGCDAERGRLLSAQERARSDSFRRQEPRTQYVETRAALRLLLGIYLQRHPADVRIETTAFGKPFLASPADAWLCFNVAHSGTEALIALGRERRIGVDIERICEDIDYACLMQNYFHLKEIAELAQLPASERLQAFFDCWTRKEAYLKATGHGLSTPLDSFQVSATPGASSALLSVKGDRFAAAGWTLRDIPVAPGYAGAVAAEGEILALRCLDFRSGHN
jgi:4'-phosphopantetheinyl transferase